MNQVADENIEHLNADCTCITLDREALCRALVEAVGDTQFCSGLIETHRNLISAQPMFLSRAHADEMQDVIRAIELIAAHPAFRESVELRSGEMARFRPGPIGAFMGYDFHLGADGPRLIEINTNAGGALINAYLMHAQRSCCREMGVESPSAASLEALTEQFVETFRNEWRLQGRAGVPKVIAIVDDDPSHQYLYPEFQLFARLFERHGIVAVIAAPEEIEHRAGALWTGGRRIDLVYNRLTDFDLSSPTHATLRTA